MLTCMGRFLIPLILWWAIAPVIATESSGERSPFTVSKDASPSVRGMESWSIVSPWQSGTNTVEVVVPSGFMQGRTYPVVYLLPVNAGTKGPWGHPLEEILKNGLADRYQAICVTPSFALLPWYGNNPDNPSVHQTEHLLKAVVPFVESRYPVNGTNYLVGFSKSAIGALGLALEHPVKFSGVAVFENWYGEPDSLQWETWGFKECHGTREAYDFWDPGHLVTRHAVELAAKPARITVIGGGPGPRPGVDQLMDLLRQKNIPHLEIWERSMGHRWDSGWLPLAMASLLRNEAPRQAP